MLANELISKKDYEKVKLAVSEKDQKAWGCQSIFSCYKSSSN